MHCYLVILLMLFSQILQAGDKEYDACMSNSETNYDYSSCGEAYLERLDSKLNLVWRDIYSTHSESRHLLLEEQRKWIPFKESSCRYLADTSAYGTAGRDIYFYECRSKIIQQRIKELQESTQYGCGLDGC